MDNINVAVLGLGSISQIAHIPVLSKMENVNISAVCDIDKAKTKSIASKYNVGFFTSNTDEFFEKAEADIIIIATPTFLHKDHSIRAFERGFNVFVEKPLARNTKEAEEMVNVSEKYRKNFMVGMNTRFRPDIMMQESFISGNELGDIFYIKSGFLKKISTHEEWFLNKEYSGGGVVMDLGIVMIDIILWLLKFPKIRSVSAVNYFHSHKTVEDTSVVLLKFENNKSASVELSWTLQREDDLFYCNVYGTEGSSSINPLKIYKKIRGTIVNITPVKVEKPDNIFKSSYKYELKYMINNLNTEYNPNIFCSGKESLLRMKIVDAIYKSAKTGKEVYFND